jgi:SSS family transporter
MTAIDLVVLVVYLGASVALGLWWGRAQKDTRDYFLGGHAIPWWAVLISVVATETSALTFVSIPGLAYVGNLGFLQIAAGYILGRIVVSYTLLPRYWEGELVTAYALLERRFGVATRRLASIVFMVTRALGDSVRLFATAIPIALILGRVVPHAMPVAILVLGLLTTVYTYHGGVRAVVWTDVLQWCVYVVGSVVALILVLRATPGALAAPGKLQIFDLHFGFDRPHTLWAGLIGGAFLSMASHGADQLIVQRLFASGNLRDARRALIGSGVVVCVQFALFLLLGVGLFAHYGGQHFDSPDAIFPRFILERMPPGLVGLVVAAILAATMSMHAGAINSLAAATLHDIVLPLSRKSISEAQALRLGKRFALGWGLVLTIAALLYRAQGTPVVVIALSIASFTYGALLGGFFLGLFWPRARQRDAMAGMIAGIVGMSALGLFAHIAWPWYVLIGTCLTLFVGVVCSLQTSSCTPRVACERSSTQG